MPNTVIALKKSATPSAIPANLANGELAINFADGKLFYKAANGTIASISTAAVGSSYGVVNANGTLLLSAISGDTFSILPGQNITITGDAINDRVTISADLTPANNYAGAMANSANANASTLYAPKASPTFTGTVSFTANIANQTLTHGTFFDWNLNNGQVATITLTGNVTANAPTNLKVGTYILHVIQDATGSRTITWNSVFKWPAAIAPVLTTTGNRRDIISFVCDGTNLYGSFLPDVR